MQFAMIYAILVVYNTLLLLCNIVFLLRILVL